MTAEFTCLQAGCGGRVTIDTGTSHQIGGTTASDGRCEDCGLEHRWVHERAELVPVRHRGT